MTRGPDGGIWPRLRGPTGFRIGHGWVLAYFVGVPIAGMSYRNAVSLPDSGKSWILRSIAQHWGQDVAYCIQESPLVVERE